ncbi:hypothetical protein M501DRAFT_69973 [Patellaria atrata CBS 101060]|uniref:Uncharacterized protein n=1 Tax=Patellaria atrata CBS 101060 TaxID=1346257 RepID=A0A9P4SJ53_9PEZI|nr:hypothetical protein M501DRAFT_69973 [Patellaria atrata CBS 101060]
MAEKSAVYTEAFGSTNVRSTVISKPDIPAIPDDEPADISRFRPVSVSRETSTNHSSEVKNKPEMPINLAPQDVPRSRKISFQSDSSVKEMKSVSIQRATGNNDSTSLSEQTDDEFHISKELVQRLKRTMKLRYSVGTHRIQVINLRRRNMELRRHALVDQNELVEQFGEQIAQNAFTGETFAKFKQLHEKLLYSVNELKGFEELLIERDKRLTDLEMKVQEREEGLNHDLQHILPSGGTEYSSTQASMNEQASVSISTESSDEDDPLLEEYYDSVGDVQVSRERLRALEVDFQHKMARIARTIRPGKKVKTDDQVILNTYNMNREKLVKELTEAVEKASQLKQKCLDNSLYPDGSIGGDDPPEGIPKNTQGPGLHGSSTSDNVRSSSHNFHRFPRSKTIVGHRATHSNDITDRIQDWLTDIFQANEDILLHIQPTEEASANFWERGEEIHIPPSGLSVMPVNADSSLSSRSCHPPQRWAGDKPRRRYSEPFLYSTAIRQAHPRG